MVKKEKIMVHAVMREYARMVGFFIKQSIGLVAQWFVLGLVLFSLVATWLTGHSILCTPAALLIPFFVSMMRPSTHVRSWAYLLQMGIRVAFWWFVWGIYFVWFHASVVYPATFVYAAALFLYAADRPCVVREQFLAPVRAALLCIRLWYIMLPLMLITAVVYPPLLRLCTQGHICGFHILFSAWIVAVVVLLYVRAAYLDYQVYYEKIS